MDDKKDLKSKFEEVYSLSIRRGEDSSIVWEWLRDVLKDNNERLKSNLKTAFKAKVRDHGYRVGKKEYLSMTEKQLFEVINNAKD